MYTSRVFTLLALLSTTLSATIPHLKPRQANNNICFVVGDVALPKEVADLITSLQNVVTCPSSSLTTTIPGVAKIPDVSSGGVLFSSVNFATSSQSPLAFALDKFATSTPLLSTSLSTFENRLNTYVATEVALRSVGGNLAIKVPKFFLAFQVARIKTAKGIVITDPGQTVEHLLGKVVKNLGSKDKGLAGEVEKLAQQLA